MTDDELDGCDLDFTRLPVPDDESDLFVIFAEALDPLNPKTVDDVKAEWGVA